MDGAREDGRDNVEEGEEGDEEQDCGEEVGTWCKGADEVVVIMLVVVVVVMRMVGFMAMGRDDPVGNAWVAWMSKW